MDTTMGIVSLKKPDAPDEDPKSFTFDAVFDWKFVPKIIAYLRV